MKKMNQTIFLLFVCVHLAFCQDNATRSISKISGDLYRFQNNNHYSVFLVTSEGIIATDPISKEAATWLNKELGERFNLPVKYLIYSHNHADHISGGEAFGDDVVVVSHEITKEKIIKDSIPTTVPDITFSRRITLDLGGKKVVLIYPGKSHGDNCIIMHFPEERTVFVVDFITVNRLPYRNLNDSYFPDWMQSIAMVEALDFDILAPAHGSLGTKADATEHREYIQDLYDAVVDANLEDMSLEEMKETIKLEKYNRFDQYDAWLELNIEGMYNSVIQ